MAGKLFSNVPVYIDTYVLYEIKNDNTNPEFLELKIGMMLLFFKNENTVKINNTSVMSANMTQMGRNSVLSNSS